MRIETLFDPVFTLMISCVFASSCKIASWATTSTFEAVCQLFPVAMSTPVVSSVLSRVSDGLSDFAISFEVPFTTSLWISCCYCYTSHLLLSVTLGAGLGFESLSTTLGLLFFEKLLCKCNLLAQDYGWWSQMTSFVRIGILDLVLWIILFNRRHPGYVSNNCVNALSEESCNHHGFSSGISPTRFRSVKKTACRALSFSFPPRINPIPRIGWTLHEQPLWKIYSFQLQWLDVYPISSGTSWIKPECHWIARK